MSFKLIIYMLILGMVAVCLQEYDKGLFATEDPSYLPCGVAWTPYSRIVVSLGAVKS